MDALIVTSHVNRDYSVVKTHSLASQNSLLLLNSRSKVSVMEAIIDSLLVKVCHTYCAHMALISSVLLLIKECGELAVLKGQSVHAESCELYNLSTTTNTVDKKNQSLCESS